MTIDHLRVDTISGSTYVFDFATKKWTRWNPRVGIRGVYRDFGELAELPSPIVGKRLTFVDMADGPIVTTRVVRVEDLSLGEETE